MSIDYTIYWDKLGIVAALSSNSHQEFCSLGAASPLSPSLVEVQPLHPTMHVLEGLNFTKLGAHRAPTT